MSGARALIVLETFRLRNTIRRIFQKPSRLTSWLLFLCWFTFTMWTRSRTHAYFFPLLTQQLAAVIAGAILLFVGLRVFSIVKLGMPPVTTSAAGAMMLERTNIDERLIFLWLYLGSIAKQFTTGVVVVCVLLVNLGRNPQSFTVINFTAILLLIDVVAIPAYVLARRSRTTARVLSRAIAVAGVILIALAFVAPDSVRAYSLFFIRVWSGDATVTVSLCAAILAALACSAFVRDFFPELYERAAKLESLRERLGARHGVRNRASKSARRSFLRGPYVEIWKQLAYLRRGNGRTIGVWLVVLGPALGAIEAFLVVHHPHVASVGASFVLVAVIGITMLSSVSLAKDLSKPIWWMVDGSLFSHLCACIAAAVLPILFVIVTGCLTASLLLRQPSIFVVGTAFAITVPAGLRMIAMLGYAISPAKADQRGPGLIVRTLITYVAAAIAVGGAALGAIVFHNLSAGLIGGLVAYAGIAALALAIAVRVISGRGMEIALAENT